MLNIKSVTSLAANSFRAASANIIRLGISFCLTLWLPKMMNLSGYSRWQLYLLITSYLVFTSLGLCEGLYLEYGGSAYTQLDKTAISGQIWLLIVSQGVLCGFAWLFAPLVFGLEAKSAIVCLAFASVGLDIPRYALQCVLQATGRIKTCMHIQCLERLLFFIFVGICLAFRKIEFYYIASSEIASRLISLSAVIIICKDIVFKKPTKIITTLKHSINLVKNGFLLMASAFLAQLSYGAARVVVLWKWGELDFGGLSLALSLANVALGCAFGVGIALFPVLRRSNSEKMLRLYPVARMLVLLFSLAVMAIFPFIKALIAMWLPGFSSSITFLTLLFPICLFESRTIILTDTYFKTLKRADLSLAANGISACINIFLSVVFATIFDNILLVVLATILSSAIKSILSEKLLGKFTCFFSLKAVCFDFCFAGCFILSNLTLTNQQSFIFNLVGTLLLLLLNKQELFNMAHSIKPLIEETK